MMLGREWSAGDRYGAAVEEVEQVEQAEQD